MKTKLKTPMTDWFPPGEVPVRIGVYERKFLSASARYSYWNGKEWGANDITPYRAYLFRGCVSRHQFLPWRGLVEV